jgi:F420-non-reducing hydrogenase small subunit
MVDKPKLSMYWASSCGGCEVALVNLHEKLLELDQAFDFMFCPCLLDTKINQIEALPQGAITITLFNGAIRTAENLGMARLLRAKSKVLIAFGSCAAYGSIPALSNLHGLEEHFRTVYLDGASVANPARTIPGIRSTVPEGVLHLPEFHARVQTLAQVVGVDYFIPGCPPEPHQIWKIVEALVHGEPLPPRGSVLGSGPASVCQECTREKGDKKIPRFHRTWEIVPDPARCLLEQGIVCMGIATRQGCGALCPRVNMPCTGCYGPPEGVLDQGAKMVAALGSVLEIGDYKGMNEGDLAEKTDRALTGLPDPAGTFYKYSLAASLLEKA